MRFMCLSCGMPVGDDEKGPSESYCRYCTDERGDLRPRDQVQAGIAQWLKSLQPGISDETAVTRAGHYMLAMPAWAQD